MTKVYSKIIKPSFDFLLAIVLIILLCPVFLMIMLLLFLFQKGNVFFIQQRPGKNEKLFRLIKFKTMTDERNKEGNLLPDEKRMTKIGSFVRRTSLDELPQLINVLKGDMSFIGPRPWLIEYLPLYSDEQRKRHYVKPGISGWAQVNGRNQLTWEDRFKYDLYYVNNQSLWFDLKIGILTIHKIIKAEGVANKGHVTMPRFKGGSKR